MKNKDFIFKLQKNPEWLNIICIVNWLLKTYVNDKRYFEYVLIPDTAVFFNKKKNNQPSMSIRFDSGVRLLDMVALTGDFDIRDSSELESFASFEDCFLDAEYDNVFSFIAYDIEQMLRSGEYEGSDNYNEFIQKQRQNIQLLKSLSTCKSFAELEVKLAILGY